GCGAPAACWGARACGVGRRVRGTTRSYAGPTPAGLTRLGSPVRRTPRVVLRRCPRRATPASLGPWRGGGMRGHAPERGPKQSIPIPGAPLGSWHTGRQLYRQVSNFVGSVVSPVLANVFLHYVLDVWLEKVVKRHCRGEACLLRYADDFVCAFED